MPSAFAASVPASAGSSDKGVLKNLVPWLGRFQAGVFVSLFAFAETYKRT